MSDGVQYSCCRKTEHSPCRTFRALGYDRSLPAVHVSQHNPGSHTCKATQERVLFPRICMFTWATLIFRGRSRAVDFDCLSLEGDSNRSSGRSTVRLSSKSVHLAKLIRTGNMGSLGEMKKMRKTRVIHKECGPCRQGSWKPVSSFLSSRATSSSKCVDRANRSIRRPCRGAGH